MRSVGLFTTPASGGHFIRHLLFVTKQRQYFETVTNFRYILKIARMNNKFSLPVFLQKFISV